MEDEMDASPSYFNPEDFSTREQFRRFRKRQTTSFLPLLGNSVSKFSEASLLYDGNNIQRRPNAALLLEEIKQEADNFDIDGPEGTLLKAFNSSKRSVDNHALSEQDAGLALIQQVPSQLLKSCKNEDEVLADGGESTYTLFASLLDSALQGLMPFSDLILRFENTCRNVSESIRYGTTGRHRVVEDKFMQQNARLLLDEAASWSLLWYLFGKGNEVLPENLILYPTTSHQEATQFVMEDHTTQLCLRIVLWLEGLASEALDLEKKMNLMVLDISNLLDLLWSWVSPSEDDQNNSRPYGDPQMIRFGAHLVLFLRYLLDDEAKDAFKEKLATVGDLILHMYAMFLFSKQHEELVGLYASQLARHLCIDLFVHMMELRLNGSIHVKYKLFLSAMEYLPFSSEDDARACFEDIIERVLSRSREIKISKYDGQLSDVVEQHRLQSLQKAMAIQWLCFTPSSTINNFEIIKAKLLMTALMHSNVLFREFALISMWRVPKMPIGAHKLLSFLAEPLKQPKDTLLSIDDHDIAENLYEFEDWREYYSCDATYRKWLKIELENASVSLTELSLEEKERAIAEARETLKSSFSILLRR